MDIEWIKQMVELAVALVAAAVAVWKHIQSVKAKNSLADHVVALDVVTDAIEAAGKEPERATAMKSVKRIVETVSLENGTSQAKKPIAQIIHESAQRAQNRASVPE